MDTKRTAKLLAAAEDAYRGHVDDCSNCIHGGDCYSRGDLARALGDAQDRHTESLARDYQEELRSRCPTVEVPLLRPEDFQREALRRMGVQS